MGKLFRRTCAFTNRQMEHLREKAKKLEISIADVLRRLVDDDIDKTK